jgi:hypothetical protein
MMNAEPRGQEGKHPEITGVHAYLRGVQECLLDVRLDVGLDGKHPNTRGKNSRERKKAGS